MTASDSPDSLPIAATATLPPTRPFALWLARGVWVLLTLVALVTFLFGLPAFYKNLLSYPNSAYTIPQWTPASMTVALDSIGLSVSSFAALLTALSLYKFFVFCGLGLFLFIKRSHSLFGLYVSLLMFLTGAFWGFHTLTPWTPLIGWVNQFISSLLLTGMISLVYLFPNGRFVPRWSLALVPLWFLVFLAANILIFLFNTGQLNTPNPTLTALLVGIAASVLLGLIGLIISMGIAQVYRYRAASNAVERQQSKWFLFAALLVAVLVLAFGAVIPLVFPSVMTTTATGLRYALLSNSIIAVVWTLLPLAIAIAVLRYRLWDIDLLINRTLVYVPLTGILSGLFAISSDLSKQLITDLTGAANNGGVVATLLVVATFDPLKKVIEGFVDRVFKEPPDPTKQLRAYSEQVRDVMHVMDVEWSARRLLDETIAAFGATGGKIVLGPAHSPRVTYTRGDWANEAALTFVLKQDTAVGVLSLGPRKNGKPYSETDQQLLEKYLAPIAHAIAWAERATTQELDVAE